MKYRILNLLICISLCCGLNAELIVNTTLGPVLGTTATARNGRVFSAFLGIPFGKSLRFQAPDPADPWREVRDATKYGPWCISIEFHVPFGENDTVVGQEDCLVINVFSNYNFEDGEDKPLFPVLAFVHGGYFMGLSGSYHGPRYLMDHDIIYVSFNYRLGPFGFLSTEDSAAPGNAGMKDMVLALKWVQENIRYFGGDPARVTIYGESAGAAAIQYLLLSPESDGLYSGAISGSGIAFKVYSHQRAPLKAAERVALDLGCGDFIGDNVKMIECLKEVPAVEMARNTDEFNKILKDHNRMFSPSTETVGSSSNPFLTQDPYQVMFEGRQQRIPWMIGVNSGESLWTTMGILGNAELVEDIENNWGRNVSHKFLLYDNSFSNYTELISNAYLSSFNRETGEINFRQDFNGFTNMLSDRYYIHAAIEAAKVQSQYSPVFLYYNDFVSDRNPIEDPLGVIHGEEVYLLFSPEDLDEPLIGVGHPDYEESRVMVDLYVKFVKDPFNVTYGGVKWPQIGEDLTCFIFRNPERGHQGVAPLPKEVVDRLKFWSDAGIPPYQEHVIS